MDLNILIFFLVIYTYIYLYIQRTFAIETMKYVNFAINIPIYKNKHICLYSMDFS